MAWRRPIPGLYRKTDHSKTKLRNILIFGVGGTSFLTYAVFFRKGDTNSLDNQMNRFNVWKKEDQPSHQMEQK